MLEHYEMGLELPLFVHQVKKTQADKNCLKNNKELNF